MSAPLLVLLPGAAEARVGWPAVRDAVAGRAEALVPELALDGDGPVSLRALAAGAAEAWKPGRPAVVCGAGLGALVALQLATDHPERVASLALLTRQVRPSGLLLSLPAAVLPLLPAAAVARLGAGREQVLGLLDQVRPVDAVPLARRVTVPAVVVCGTRDRVNRRASAALARALPAGSLRLVAGAGPGWWQDRPGDLLDVLL